jgi:hypothetical protein
MLGQECAAELRTLNLELGTLNAEVRSGVFLKTGGCKFLV